MQATTVVQNNYSTHWVRTPSPLPRIKVVNSLMATSRPLTASVVTVRSTTTRPLPAAAAVRAARVCVVGQHNGRGHSSVGSVCLCVFPGVHACQVRNPFTRHACCAHGQLGAGRGAGPSLASPCKRCPKQASKTACSHRPPPQPALLPTPSPPPTAAHSRPPTLGLHVHQLGPADQLPALRRQRRQQLQVLLAVQRARLTGG